VLREIGDGRAGSEPENVMGNRRGHLWYEAQDKETGVSGLSSRIIFSLVWITLSLASPLSAQSADLARVSARIETEIQTILEETGIPAISIALVMDGDIYWTGAFGYANIGASVPASTETRFSTGSTFKFVTATALMQLVDEGLLTLDTSLNEVLGPDLALEGADDVTFRHVLSHHSGLEGGARNVPLWSRRAPRPFTEVLESIERTAPPGEKYEYCNACYGILAWVIEKVSGLTYDEFVAQHVLQPLGLEISEASIPTPSAVEHLALPYALRENRAYPVSQVRFDVYAAGDVYLRAEDMARFLAAQLNGGVFRGLRILSEASVREMQRQQFDSYPYGLGTRVQITDGRTFLHHSGSIPGFNSFFVGSPEEEMGVYIMANGDDAMRALGALSQLSLRLMRGEDPGPLPSFAVGGE